MPATITQADTWPRRCRLSFEMEGWLLVELRIYDDGDSLISGKALVSLLTIQYRCTKVTVGSPHFQTYLSTIHSLVAPHAQIGSGGEVGGKGAGD
jgi:hypothetical protein